MTDVGILLNNSYSETEQNKVLIVGWQSVLASDDKQQNTVISRQVLRAIPRSR